MTDAALVQNGRVVQVWRNTPLSSINRTGLVGELIAIEGGIVVPGMMYREDRFWRALPRPSWKQIREEANRRIAVVFPPALQEQIASLGGEIAAKMHGYILAVERQSQAHAQDAALQGDITRDELWPALPDVSSSPVPIPMASATLPNLATPQPVEVRVIVSEQVRPEPRVIEVTPNRRNVVPLRPVESEDLTEAKLAAVKAMEAVANAHGFEVERLASIAAAATAADTRSGIEDALRRAEALVRGAA